MIYIIGDSHCNVFGDTPYFKKIWLGAGRTAHQIQKSLGVINSHLRDKLPTDIVIFSFGEVDCRIHIYNKHKIEGTPILDLVINTVQRYVDCVSEYKFSFAEVCVLHIIPTGTEGNVWNMPHFANREQRNEITTIFNIELKRYCEQKGVKFLDVYDQVTDDQGYRLPKFSRDDVHLTKEHAELIYEKYFKKHDVVLKNDYINPYPIPVNIGWKCPVCECGNAPFVATCSNCISKQNLYK